MIFRGFMVGGVIVGLVVCVVGLAQDNLVGAVFGGAAAVIAIVALVTE